MLETRSQRREQVKYPSINIKVHLVLQSTVSETFASGKTCFRPKNETEDFSWLWFYKQKFLFECIQQSLSYKHHSTQISDSHLHKIMSSLFHHCESVSLLLSLGTLDMSFETADCHSPDDAASYPKGHYVSKLLSFKMLINSSHLIQRTEMHSAREIRCSINVIEC